MAEIKKYLDLATGLPQLVTEIKEEDAKALQAAKDYADSLAKNYDSVGTAQTKADAALEAAKAHTDALANGQVKLNKEAIEKLNGDATTEGSVAKAVKDAKDALQGNIDAVDAKAIKNAQDIAAINNAETGILAQAKADATEKADAVQGAVDDLEAYVGEFTSENAKTVVEYIDEKTANIASDATVNALADRVTQAEKDIDAIEADYLKAKDKEDLQGAIDELAQTHVDDKAELEASIKGITDDYLKAADKTELTNAINAEKDRAEAAESGLNTRLAVVEGDYLKTEDKTELEEAIATEKSRAEGIEAGLRTDVNTIMGDYLKAADKTELQGNIDTLTGVVETLRDGIDAEKVDGVKDLIDYVEEHGTEVTGMKEDIAKNTAAIDAEKARTEGVEAGFETRIKANEDAVATVDSRIATAKEQALATAEAKAKELDAALETTLKAYADSKVEGVDLSGIAANAGEIATLKGQMTEVQGAVATKVETTDYEAKVAELEGADADQVERIEALEAKFVDGEGSVEDMIADAVADGVADAVAQAEAKDATLKTEVNAYTDTEVAKDRARLDALEEDSAKHALATDLTALAGRVETAEGEIDTLQGEMDAVEALAAANKTAHEANAATIALKASQADLEAAVTKIDKNEDDIAAINETLEDKADVSVVTGLGERLTTVEGVAASNASFIAGLKAITADEVSALFK